jgi:hypothetical protein
MQIFSDTDKPSLNKPAIPTQYILLTLLLLMIDRTIRGRVETTAAIDLIIKTYQLT